MKKKAKKLGLTRETLTNLNSEALGLAGQAAVAPVAGTFFNCPCQESQMICSVMHTCVSCNRTETWA
ncbi:MAG TPA: hypothetical protein VEL74_12900 [Thermoanaerobaculia bacterium]|nr:hypothetical protein [Thermoanaerobaculia bacterium]